MIKRLLFVIGIVLAIIFFPYIIGKFTGPTFPIVGQWFIGLVVIIITTVILMFIVVVLATVWNWLEDIIHWIKIG